MAKIKHFDQMSSITAVKDGLLWEIRVQETLGWPLIKWSRPTPNRLRKILKYAQSRAPIPDHLLHNPGCKILGFLIPQKNGKSTGSITMLHLMDSQFHPCRPS